MSAYKGVIFDLDGTLVDSLEDIADSMNQVLSSHRLPGYDLQTYKSFIGSGIKELVKKALPPSQQEEDQLNRFIGEMSETYRKNCIRKTKPYEGILPLLEALLSRDLSLAILTNKPEELTRRMVPALFPKPWFRMVSGMSEQKQKKPDPQEALRISRELNIPPEKMLFVGDTGIDIRTALNAGMFPVGVLWGYRSEQDLRQSGARHLLNHPMELLHLL